MRTSQQTADSTLRSRLLKGTGAQAFAQAVQVFIRLSEVPLLLAFWGAQSYGEWLMLSAIPVYLNIGDGGFATAARREMTMRNSAGDRRGTLIVFQSTWLLLIVVSMSIGLLTFGFLEIAPLKNWLGFSVMTAWEVKVVLLLQIANVLIGFQGGLLNGGFWVTGHYPIGMYLSAVTQILEFACFAAAVAWGGGPVQAASWALAGRFLGTSVLWVGQRRTSPWLRHGFTHASVPELRRLATPAFASIAFPLGNALNIQSMRLVVGLALGPSAVAVFTPLRTLSRLALQPKQVINVLIEPELALAYGSRSDALFRRIFLQSCQLAVWACLVSSTLLFTSGGFVLKYWTADNIPMHWPVFGLLLSTTCVNSVWHTALRVPLATNRHGRVAIVFIMVYGVFSSILAFFLAHSFGLIGPGLALLLAEIVMALFTIRESLRLTTVQIGDWMKAVFYPPFELMVKVISMLSKVAP